MLPSVLFHFFDVIFNFQVETEEIGVLTKLRVGHDNKGFNSAWYLEKIIVRRLKPPKNDDEEKNEKRKSMKKQGMMNAFFGIYDQSIILDCKRYLELCMTALVDSKYICQCIEILSLHL